MPNRKNNVPRAGKMGETRKLIPGSYIDQMPGKQKLLINFPKWENMETFIGNIVFFYNNVSWFPQGLQFLQRPLIVRFTCSEIGEVVKGIPNLCICLYGRATHQTPQIDTHIPSLLFIYNSHITYNLTFPTHRIN